MFQIDREQLAQELPALTNLIPIDVGGFKAVISAEHSEYGSVVLKLIHNPSEPERLQREIEFQMSNSLPFVPTLFEHGPITYCESSVYSIIEERIIGANLQSEISTNGPLGLSRSVILIETLLTVASSYEPLNVIHRDIKPQNILCKDDGSFWLIDFGIARHLEQASLTPSFAQMGPSTLGYASPEQLKNIKPAIRIQADLFSIGVVGYEALTGINPFLRNGRTPEGFLMSVNSVLPPLMDVYDQDLYEFLTTMMGRLPSLRPESAAYALQWLKQIFPTQTGHLGERVEL